MIKRYEDISLRGRNSFGFEVRALRLIEFETPEDLRTIFGGVVSPLEKWRVLGSGNNILFSGDFDGVLLHPVSCVVEVVEQAGDRVVVRADAGLDWDDFVAWCVARGLWGVENLSYIPGTVGAAPIQNIGAYGCEVSDTIVSVESYSPAGDQVEIRSVEQCKFGYRESIFKSELAGKVIITAVSFELSRVPNPRLGYGDLLSGVTLAGGATLENIRTTVIAIRRAKLPEPSEIGNAGSFFKNPVVSLEIAERLRALYPDIPMYDAGDGAKKLAAGWLIDRAGWRGLRRGDAGVHERQALVLVNYGGATGEQILELAGEICADIVEKFGVELQMEVNVF